METRFRSAVKSIIWRVTGVAILAAITWLFTKSWIQTGLVTFLHHGVFLLVFYFHERIWLRYPIKSTVRQSVYKMLTYETLCGNVILGSISYIVTGDFLKMTYITITYIGIKHLCYVLNEFIWKRCLIGIYET